MQKQNLNFKKGPSGVRTDHHFQFDQAASEEFVIDSKVWLRHVVGVEEHRNRLPWVLRDELLQFAGKVVVLAVLGKCTV